MRFLLFPCLPALALLAFLMVLGSHLSDYLWCILESAKDGGQRLAAGRASLLLVREDLCGYPQTGSALASSSRVVCIIPEGSHCQSLVTATAVRDRSEGIP